MIQILSLYLEMNEVRQPLETSDSSTELVLQINGLLREECLSIGFIQESPTKNSHKTIFETNNSAVDTDAVGSYA